MRVVVIGGNGRTGRLVVEKLLRNGDSVLATIRNPKHMVAMAKLGAESIVLDLEKSALDDFVWAFKEADAVVFAAGSAAGEGSALDRIGTVRTLRATANAGVKRYISISSIGASTGLSTRSMSDEMKDYYKQKRTAGKHIVASGLAWTILEPAELTDEKGTGKVTMSETATEEGTIPREDVAAAVVAVLAEPKSAGHAYQLTSGKTAIKTALAKLVG